MEQRVEQRVEQSVWIEADGRKVVFEGEVEYVAGRYRVTPDGVLARVTPDCVRITAEPSLLDALTFALTGQFHTVSVCWGAHRVQFGPATVEFELGTRVVELRQA